MVHKHPVKQPAPAVSNSRGFTLIEMLIALVIILVALLGLVQAALLAIDNNLKNLLRDEAVRLAEEQMNVLKSQPFSSTSIYNPPNSSGLKATANQPIYPYPDNNNHAFVRSFGTFKGKYYVYYTVKDLVTSPPAKSIQVYVGWSYKNQTTLLQTPSNQEFQYMMTSMVASSS